MRLLNSADIGCEPGAQALAGSECRKDALANVFAPSGARGCLTRGDGKLQGAGLNGRAFLRFAAII